MMSTNITDLIKYRVLVTPNSYGKFNKELMTDLENSVGEVIYNTTGKPMTAEQVSKLIPGIDGYIAGLDQIDRAALQFADRLKVIARYGVGVDKVDLVAASEKGIIVTNTPAANATSVAELALTLILMLARQIPDAMTSIKQGEWPRKLGLTLENKIIGIMGLGAIGKQLAKRLRGFDCQILAYDPKPDVDFSQQYNVKFVSSEQLISDSDFISLHLPVLPETREMVNKQFLHSMKKGAFLINTSRGEIVDESALIDAIMIGHLGGAALDAFLKEPPDIDNPLLSLPQVICTPHLGAQTDGSTNNMGRIALDDCLRVLRGEEPKYKVN